MSEEKIAKAQQWFRKKEWAPDLPFNAHQSTDVLEFYFHYAHNRERWHKAFAFLKETNLDIMEPGKYKIDHHDVYASIAEAETKKPEDARWEAHRKYIDIQYVISGKEIIGVAPLSKAVSIEPFRDANDIGFYEIPEADCQYYEALPGTFFIFFPGDVHRPCLKAKGTDRDKKLVIKIKI